ncbi:MAG: hypothetical protein M3Y09_17555 [Actinomycetota bacterium]|nr:hypothetical protein [Actinomycetota bacterium]
MIRAALLPLLCLAACADAPAGDWPSLALRPGEAQPLVTRPVAAGRGEPAAPVAAAVPVDAVRDAEARAGSLERDVGAYEKRLRAQLADTEAAGGKTGADAASSAQLELTRLDRLGSQAGDLRDRYNELAGDLARQAAAGGDVTALLSRIGTGIDKVEGLRAEQAKTYAGIKAAVPVPN